LPKDKAIIPLENCLYNIDSIKSRDTIVIVEGVTDVWRLGSGTIGTFGTNFEFHKKFSMLLDRMINQKIERIFVIFDSGLAQKFAKKLVNDLSIFIDHVERLELKWGDPADMSDKEVKQMKKDLRI